MWVHCCVLRKEWGLGGRRWRRKYECPCVYFKITEMVLKYLMLGIGWCLCQPHGSETPLVTLLHFPLLLLSSSLQSYFHQILKLYLCFFFPIFLPPPLTVLFFCLYFISLSFPNQNQTTNIFLFTFQHVESDITH